MISWKSNLVDQRFLLLIVRGTVGLEAAGPRYTGHQNGEYYSRYIGRVATQALWGVREWKLWSRGESSTGLKHLGITALYRYVLGMKTYFRWVWPPPPSWYLAAQLWQGPADKAQKLNCFGCEPQWGLGKYLTACNFTMHSITAWCQFYGVEIFKGMTGRDS